MKYDELLEKAKMLSDMDEITHKTAFVIKKDMYNMLLRFKQERKVGAIPYFLRSDLENEFSKENVTIRMKHLYFLLRYVYLKTFEEEA